MDIRYGFNKQLKIGKYKILEIIGQGSEGKVYKVEYAKQAFALKQIKPMFKVNLEIYENIKENDNLVQFIETFNHNQNSYEVFEFCEGGNLSQLLQKQQFNKNSIIQFIKQFCNGYKELYRNNIIHRDIKPENIVFKNNKAKIADFGFARFVLNPDIKQELSIRCTPLYASPQLLEGYFSSKCDVWSFGLILYKMVYGSLPNEKIKGLSELQDFFQDLKHNRVHFPENDMPSVVTLIKQMLRYSEDDRITWVQIFEHPLIRQNDQHDLQVYSPRSIEEFNMLIYFENKIYQLQLFNSLISNQESDLEQILIILNLWLSYILKLNGEINGSIIIKSLEQKQQIFINGSQAKRLRNVIKEYLKMVENQIKFINFLDQQKCANFYMKNQNYPKLNGLEQKEYIESLNCSQDLKEQLKQIFKS
ncbi:unnamed protein product [Paramecium pentaurelia]|uniref:Protein kinase domain-containing protein n=1 Tax=Paramecium pentaurelia TaxID=43138 RepID=A0A8S1XB07_9CILI|nr:unnamed protein product [Paramecium pentaurelia]